MKTAVHNFKGYAFVDKIPITMAIYKRMNQSISFVNQIKKVLYKNICLW